MYCTSCPNPFNSSTSQLPPSKSGSKLVNQPAFLEVFLCRPKNHDFRIKVHHSQRAAVSPSSISRSLPYTTDWSNVHQNSQLKSGRSRQFTLATHRHVTHQSKARFTVGPRSRCHRRHHHCFREARSLYRDHSPNVCVLFIVKRSAQSQWVLLVSQTGTIGTMNRFPNQQFPQIQPLLPLSLSSQRLLVTATPARPRR